MTSHCFFCKQPIAETASESGCPNCGAPLSFQTDVSLDRLPPTPSQMLLQPGWASERQLASLRLGQTGVCWTGQIPAPGTLFAEPSAASANPTPATPNTGHLAGRVDTTPTKHTSDIPLERWSQGVLHLFFPPLFRMLSRYIFVVNAESSQAPTKQTMTVYTLRVRRDDETLAEARIEGDILEGEPSLGDRVWLRGHYRGNTLIVDEGYNLSFAPEVRIKIRSPLPLRRVRIAVVTLAMLLFTTVSAFLPFLSLFSYHSGTVHRFAAAQQYLLQNYLAPGIVFGFLAYILFGLSGWLIRILLLALAVVVVLAVYTALGGSALLIWPINMH